MRCNINGRWADQSISKPSNTKSVKNMTAILLLKIQQEALWSWFQMCFDGEILMEIFYIKLHNKISSESK